ncbi:hypothetical protein J3F84DRAFT_389300 [Trichoderma pleuroticola]
MPPFPHNMATSLFSAPLQGTTKPVRQSRFDSPQATSLSASESPGISQLNALPLVRPSDRRCPPLLNCLVFLFLDQTTPANKRHTLRGRRRHKLHGCGPSFASNHSHLPCRVKAHPSSPCCCEAIQSLSIPSILLPTGNTT